MNVNFWAFNTRVGRIFHRHGLTSFSNIDRLCSSSVKFAERKLELKPFWKLQALMKNVSLELRPTVDEKFSVRHSTASRNLAVEHDYKSNIAIVKFAAKEQSKVSISIPYHVNLEIVLEGSGDVKIADVENETVDIQGERYDVELNNLKTNSTKVVTNVGDIHGVKTLRGNLHLESREGNVVAQKLQGFLLSLSAQKGSLAIGDVYAQQLTAASDNNVRIKSVHGSCDVVSNGDIIVGTADGEVCLLTRKGNIHAHFAEHVKTTNVIADAGDVSLSFSPGLKGKFHIEARHVNDDAAKSILSRVSQRALGLGCRYEASVGDGTNRISVKSRNGSTVLKKRSWLEAVLSYDKNVRELNPTLLEL